MAAALGRRPYLAWLVRLALLAPVADLLAHDAVYRTLATETGRAGARPITEHGYWPLFVTVAVVVASTAILESLRRLAQLGRALRVPSSPVGRRDIRSNPDPPARIPRYHRELLALWPALTAVTAVIFLLQENLEHRAATGAWSGLAPLDGRLHPDALAWVIGASLVVAAAGALLRWHVRVLEHRVEVVARSRSFPRPAPERAGRTWWLVAAVGRHQRMLVRRDAGRAPPLFA